MTTKLEPVLAKTVAAALRLPSERPQRPSRGKRRWQHLQLLYREGEISRRLLLAAPLLAVGFAIWAFGGVYGWAFGLAYVLVFGAVTAWALQCLRGGMRIIWRPTYLPMLLFAGIVLGQCFGHLTAVTASTETALLHLGAAGAVFLLVSQCYRADRDAGWISLSFAVFTAALALLAILQALTASNAIYWHFTYTYASPAGSFVNRNHFSGCMEMLLPIACVAAYQRRQRPWLYFLPWAAPPALGVAAIIVAASRGGAAALATEAAAGLLALLYLGRRPRPAATVASAPTAAATPGWLPLPLPNAMPQPERRQGSNSKTWHARRASDPWPVAASWVSDGPARLVTVLVACALTLALVMIVGSGDLQARLLRTNLHAPNLEQRTELNLSSLAMFRQRPVWGWGLGTWADVYPGFARSTDTSIYAFAHNDYLQLLAETGLAGVGCALLFWFTWEWEFGGRIHGWREAFPGGRGAPPPVPLALGAAIACLGILVHSWVDFNLHIPANLMLFFIMAALATPSADGTLSL